MTASSFLCTRTASRLLSLSSPSSPSFRPSSYNFLRRTNNTRQLSSSSTAQNPKQNSFSDRGLVIGLLTLTTLIGFGFQTRSQSHHQRASVPPFEQSPSRNKSTSSTKTEYTQGTASSGEDQDGKVGEGSSLPDESEQGGAFNPETGEINWDCPCLGGMAHGSCGDQFKAAFSCFVYSQQEPKGVECIEKFQLMQECFKDHPDEYGPELADTDDPTSEEEDLVAASSEGRETSSSESVPQENQTSSTERELTPNRSSPAERQDSELVDRPRASSVGPPSETVAHPPDSSPLRSNEVDSDGKSNLL